MRKVALLATTAVAALGITSPAWAVNADQTISIKLKPSKAGTKKKPANVKITVQTDTTPKDAVPFATKQAVIHFDKNLIFNPKKFKTCSAQVIQQNEASCPKGSKVGGGTSIGTAIGQTSNLTVSAFNGPNGKFMLHVTASTPLQIDGVIQATLKRGHGQVRLQADRADPRQPPAAGAGRVRDPEAVHHLDRRRHAPRASPTSG